MCDGKDDTDDDDDKGAEDKGARCEYVLEGVNMDANVDVDVDARTDTHDSEHVYVLPDQGFMNRFIMANIDSAMGGKGETNPGEISQEIISLS
ncbi:hypothetical protein RI054_24g104460 [Pseudoscourfieldia marina]